MVAHEEAAQSRPRPVILRRVAATRSQSWPDWNRDSAVELAAQRAPSTPPHGIAAKPTGRGTLRSLTPSAFSHPWQRATLGLPSPNEVPNYLRRLRSPPQTPFGLLLRYLRVIPSAPSTIRPLTWPSYMTPHGARGGAMAYPQYPLALCPERHARLNVSESRQPQPLARGSAAVAPRYREADDRHRSRQARFAW